MDLKDLKVGLMLPGGFRRLAVHAGALKALVKLALFKPVKMAAASAGALMALAYARWTKSQAKKVVEAVGDLSYRKIFTVPMETAIPGAALATAATFPLWSHVEPKKLSAKKRLVLHAAQAAVTVLAFFWFGSRFMKSKSVFSNHPLFDLLSRTLDFKSIADSDVEVEVIMCGIPKGQDVIMSTHEEGLTFDDVVAAGIATSSIPLYFPTAEYRGQAVGDGELRQNYPVDRLDEMDVIFRLSYFEPEPYPEWETLWDFFNVIWSIFAKDNYERQRDAYAARREADPSLPEVVELFSKQPIPRFEVDSFSKSGLSYSIDLGEQVIADNRELIETKLQEALERKRNHG